MNQPLPHHREKIRVGGVGGAVDGFLGSAAK